jgi:protein-L-isoaspartate(D-aspartate) O-methyltransferase
VMKITRTGNGYHAEAIRGLEIFPCRGRGNTGLDERVTDWWEKASALAPLRFHSIAKGLPSEKPKRRKKQG